MLVVILFKLHYDLIFVDERDSKKLLHFNKVITKI